MKKKLMLLFGLFIIENISGKISESDTLEEGVTSSQNLYYPPLPDFISKPLQVFLKSKENDYGLSEVREGVKLFWWLYFANGTKVDAEKKPLIIWIQGGPSLPGSGIGNFLEIGPNKFEQRNNRTSIIYRKHTWVNDFNVLFVDSPVGTGFSYAANSSLYCKRDKDVAADLVELVKILIKKYPAFIRTPTHVVSQSYGTRVAPYFGYYLQKAINNTSIAMNLKSIALGGSFISPKESTKAFCEYMYQMAIFDLAEYTECKDIALDIITLIDREEYKKAWERRYELMSLSSSKYNAVNIFNKNSLSDGVSALLTYMMNVLVKPMFDLPLRDRSWAIANHEVIENLSGDIMKSSENIVEKILNETNLKVVVYNGNFDAITPVAGASNWVHGLRWSGQEQFLKVSKEEISGSYNGFYKAYDRLSLWSIFRAGHHVPEDNPEAMKHVLDYMTT